jgi:phosphoglycolate phosphatase
MKYQHILFDLDGTLTDPKEGITKSAAYALEQFGIKENPDDLTFFIGPPLIPTFMNHYGFSHEDAVEAVRLYRVRYAEVGLFENKPYEGIIDLLAALKREGSTLLVATSKPTVFSQKIIDRYGIGRYIDYLAGSNLDNTRGEKAEVIAYAEELAGIKDKSSAIMIGDTKFDIIGGKARGMQTVGVLYGYGTEESLKAEGADFIAPEVKDLYEILM